MTTKLTLTIDDTVVSVAKKYAKQKGKSLSGMVENYLLTLTTPDKKEETLSAAVLKLKGVIELPEDFDYKQALTTGLASKYKP